MRTFRTNLTLYFEQRTQKNQIRLLIESMQSFAEEAKSSPGATDSPTELLKDILMHLIQEEKHKTFQAEDWFQLINAMHQFLTDVGPQADMD